MFSSRTDRVRDAAKLLTAAIAFGTSPGVKSGTSLYDAAKKLAGKPPKGLKAMGERMGDLATEVFEGFRHDLPEDADIRLAQMIEISLPSAELITANRMNGPLIAEAMVGKLSDASHLAQPIPDLFRDVVTPVLRELCNDKDFTADLTPAYMAQVLSQGAETASDVKDIKAMMSEVLHEVTARSDEELRQAAAYFPDAPDASATRKQLMTFLSSKGEEYEALSAELAAIDDQLKQLGALRVSAEGALDRWDLEESARVFADLHKTQLDHAAHTAELRANIALMRGDPAQAYQYLTAAADSLSGDDPLASARRRITVYGPMLVEGARRFPPETASYGRALVENVLTDELAAQSPVLWGNGQNVLGVACATLLKTALPDYADSLLRDGDRAFAKALPSRPKDTQPDAWAELHNNRSQLYKLYAETVGNPQYLDMALSDIDAALTVYSKDTHPREFARARLNHGSILTAQMYAMAQRGEDYIQTGLDAVEDYEAALDHFVFLKTPDVHIDAQVDLGILHLFLGMGTPGQLGSDHFTKAHKCWVEALQYFITSEQPYKKINTSIRLASWTFQRAQHDSTPDPTGELQKALEFCRLIEADLAVHPAADLKAQLDEVKAAVSAALNAQT